MQAMISAGDLMAILKVSKDSLYRYTALPNWPQPCMVSDRGERVWQVDDLPEEIMLRGQAYPVRSQVRQHLLKSLRREAMALRAPVVRPAGTAGLMRRARSEAELDHQDRARRDSALVLCSAVDILMAEMGTSARVAIIELAGQLSAGVAADALIAASAISYVKPRAGGTAINALTSRLSKMYTAYRKGLIEGDAGRYLVPGKPTKRPPDQVHVRAFLLHFCHPNRPSVSEAHRHAQAWYARQGIDAPAVDTWYRIERSLPVTVKYRGRMTGAEYRALLPYVKRDVSMFFANDFWVCDGHTFKAKVAHPEHGQPFQPEVTLVLDWVSRRVVGWSVDLSESTIAVSAALRHAQQTTRARCLIYYSDNGGGQTGRFIDCPVNGTLARQGIAHETGIPGNPQGRGIIERLWQVITIPLARTYATCLWRGADKETTRKMLVALGKKEDQHRRIVPSWRQFIEDLDAAIKHYNAHHEHRELNGLTPDQAYQARLDPDSVDLTLNDAELHDLWLPQVKRKPQRGVISLHNNEYARGALKHELHEGEEVYVRFDIHDASRVWVYRLSGEYLGEAMWNAHKTAAFPVPYVQVKREGRVDTKLKALDKKAKVAQAELGTTLEHDTLVPIRWDSVPAEPEALVAVKFEETTDEDTGSYMDTVASLRDFMDDETPSKKVVGK